MREQACECFRGSRRATNALDPLTAPVCAAALTARRGLGAAAVAGRIYVISGGPTPGDSVSAANEIFVP